MLLRIFREETLCDGTDCEAVRAEDATTIIVLYARVVVVQIMKV